MAGRPLFEPLAALLRALPGPGPCPLVQLDALFRDCVRNRIEPGAIRFVTPDADRRPYEERIIARAEVITRADNWHDFFNALVWVRFPRTKHALAKLHVERMREPHADAGRGPLRDAVRRTGARGR